MDGFARADYFLTLSFHILTISMKTMLNRFFFFFIIFTYNNFLVMVSKGGSLN